MSDSYICRTETLNNTHPCFTDNKGSCVVVTITECGLDLTGIPENEQIKEYFNVARKTGLSTILSHADAMEVTTDRFMATAAQMVQKMRTRTEKPAEQPSKPRDCNGAPFGTNVFCDFVNYGMTLFD